MRFFRWDHSFLIVTCMFFVYEVFLPQSVCLSECAQDWISGNAQIEKCVFSKRGAARFEFPYERDGGFYV